LKKVIENGMKERQKAELERQKEQKKLEKDIIDKQKSRDDNYNMYSMAQVQSNQEFAQIDKLGGMSAMLKNLGGQPIRNNNLTDLTGLLNNSTSQLVAQNEAQGQALAVAFGRQIQAGVNANVSGILRIATSVNR